MAEGDVGRVQSPALEVLGDRISLYLARLATAIALAALVVGGALLLSVQMGGWHHRLGEVMAVSGRGGMLVIQVGAGLRNEGER